MHFRTLRRAKPSVKDAAGPRIYGESCGVQHRDLTRRRSALASLPPSSPSKGQGRFARTGAPLTRLRTARAEVGYGRMMQGAPFSEYARVSTSVDTRFA